MRFRHGRSGRRHSRRRSSLKIYCQSIPARGVDLQDGLTIGSKIGSSAARLIKTLVRRADPNLHYVLAGRHVNQLGENLRSRLAFGQYAQPFFGSRIYVAAVNDGAIDEDRELRGPEAMLADKLQMRLFGGNGCINRENCCDQQNGNDAVACPERHLAEAQSQRLPARRRDDVGCRHTGLELFCVILGRGQRHIGLILSQTRRTEKLPKSETVEIAKKGRIFSDPLVLQFQHYWTLTWVMRVAQLPNEPRVFPHVKLVAT